MAISWQITNAFLKECYTLLTGSANARQCSNISRYFFQMEIGSKKICSKVTNILSLNQNWDVSSQRYLHSRNLHYGFCSLVIRSPWNLSSHTTKRFPHFYPASFLMSFVSILKTGTLFHFTDHFCLKTCNGY